MTVLCSPLVLEQAEVRRPASRIEERTACRETLLLSCCAPAAPSSPCPARPHTSNTFPGGSLTAFAAADGAAPAGRSGPAAAATGIDFDCAHADRVAILPTAAHATLDQMFQQSAAAIIGRVKAERETTLRERVPPCVVPRRFGWTDPDKYDDAEVQLRVARADELSERERARSQPPLSCSRSSSDVADLSWLHRTPQMAVRWTWVRRCRSGTSSARPPVASCAWWKPCNSARGPPTAPRGARSSRRPPCSPASALHVCPRAPATSPVPRPLSPACFPDCWMLPWPDGHPGSPGSPGLP